MPRLTLTVSVTPRSSRPGVEQLSPGNLRVRLKSAPANGKANQELVTVLAKHYGVGKTYVEIAKGLTSKIKLVRIYLP